ncbi:hypothetical protein AQUCO_01000208v1 [Aquilegia coerulea]|uniref:Uncharacterized protein n=1 Tax=Aquilegia coerulea TaxID=218851 RepID=A0A2G5E9D8_AQUCA|nr:hypothetical protein AQUCO_01000208v1 [Aquilegia coerulea]
MASQVAQVLLQCVYDGCISTYDMEKRRRPYHRNCSCALHKSKNGSSKKCSHQTNNISYSLTKSWKEKCHLSSDANNHHQQHYNSSSFSPLHVQASQFLIETATSN